MVLVTMRAGQSQTHEGGRCFRQCLVGRGSGVDYAVADRGVSRKHCILYFRADRLAVRDLYSRSGTFVNGVRIAPFEDFYLAEGDIV